MNAIERLGEAVFPTQDPLSRRPSPKYSQDEDAENSGHLLQESESRDVQSEKEVIISQQQCKYFF